MTPKRPLNISTITIDIKITDRHYNEHTATIEIADYETVEMFVKRRSRDRACIDGGVLMKKQYDFSRAKRGRHAASFQLEGKGVQRMHPRVVHVRFAVTQEVAAALRALRDTGLYGNGCDCASVAEELLRRALLDPEVLSHWKDA